MSSAEFAGEIAKPCPFCGCFSTILFDEPYFNGTRYWFVLCQNINCMAQGPIDLGKSGAIFKWNELNLGDSRGRE